MKDKLIFHNVQDLVVWKKMFNDLKTRITAKMKGSEVTYTVTIL